MEVFAENFEKADGNLPYLPDKNRLWAALCLLCILLYNYTAFARFHIKHA